MAGAQWTSGVVGRFDPEPGTVREARRFVARALEDVADGRADDAALLTSELATNAVIHAGSPYTVTVRRDGDRIRVEVLDASAASARRCHYSPTSGTGRGLGMVEDVAAAWGVEDTADGGKVVWFELDPPAADGAGGRAAAASVPVARPAGLDEADEAGLDALLAELGGWEDDIDLDPDPGSASAFASRARRLVGRA
jgi:anti-sigma regulatory factor (Ser/Thr protein kinase)